MAPVVSANNNLLNNVIRVLWMCVFCYQGSTARFTEEPGRTHCLHHSTYQFPKITHSPIMVLQLAPLD
ncbi:hypothetical protein MTP99_001654 [Tenebrio molitor]|nr:hypothetical protein MTP99_001654 [Tenebrio molitor]